MNDNGTTALGERIKSLRIERGFTQVQLAEAIDSSQQAIQHLEKGLIKRPRQIEKIAKVLGVSPAWLLYGDKGLIKTYTNEIPILETTKIINWLKIFDLSQYENQHTLVTNAKISNRAFAIKITGDAMLASTPTTSLAPGEISIVDPDISPQPYDLVIAEIDGDMKIRQLVKDGNETYLKASNPLYPLIKVDEKVHILGVIVETRRELHRKQD